MKPLRRSFFGFSSFRLHPFAALINPARKLRRLSLRHQRRREPPYFYRQGEYFVLEQPPGEDTPVAPLDARAGFVETDREGRASGEPSTSVLDDYQAVIDDFILSIRQSSPPAAVCIEQLNDTYGIRAAYLAAFALLRLKQLQELHGYRLIKRDLYQFTFVEEMREYSDALRLYEEAASYLLPDLQ